MKPSSETAALRSLVAKLDEYIAFTDKATQEPIGLAWVHGWRCPPDDFETGNKFRAEIHEIRAEAQRRAILALNVEPPATGGATQSPNEVAELPRKDAPPAQSQTPTNGIGIEQSPQK